MKHFWDDEDGFSSRDFLMVAFITVYLVEQIVVFCFGLAGGLNKDALTVIQSLDTIIMTIIGGTFGIQTVRAFTDRKAGK